MEKPISMTINETKHSIIDILNSSALHPVIIKMLINELHVEVAALAENISIKEKEQYLKLQEPAEE